MSTSKPSVIAIIGAGVAGLCSANTLIKLGHKVCLIDKASAVGGRLATRVLTGGNAGQLVNTASNCIDTVNISPDFLNLLKDTCQDYDGTLRYYQPESGVNSVAKALASRIESQARLHLNSSVTSIEYESESRSFKIVGREIYYAQGVILTPPLPQALVLLKGVGTILSKLPSSITYFRSIVLLLLPKVTFELQAIRSAPHVHHVVLQDHIKHNTSPYPVAIHATYAWSDAHYSLSDSEICSELLKESNISQDSLVTYQVKRWVGFRSK